MTANSMIWEKLQRAVPHWKMWHKRRKIQHKTQRMNSKIDAFWAIFSDSWLLISFDYNQHMFCLLRIFYSQCWRITTKIFICASFTELSLKFFLVTGIVFAQKSSIFKKNLMHDHCECDIHKIHTPTEQYLSNPMRECLYTHVQ